MESNSFSSPADESQKPSIAYLQFLYIDDNGIEARINGEGCYSFELPSKWRNAIDISDSVYGACYQYEIDYLSEDNVSHNAAEAVKSYRDRNNKKFGDNRNDDQVVKKPADILYLIAQQEIGEMFRDEESQTPFAILTIDGKRYILNMESEQFRLKLRVLYENHVAGLPDTNLSKIIGEQDLYRVIQQLLARNETYRKLHLRCFFDGNTVYYDFMNKDYEYAVINSKGYTIEKDAYRLFKRYDDYHSQALPDRQSTDGGVLLDNIIKSFNIVDNEYGDKNLLFKAGLIALFFRPATRITMPIWTANGPPGSSKTSLLLLLKFIVDPISGNPKAMVNKWGREDQERDRGLAVSKNYFVVFDNLSRISNAESDELCLYATGGRKEERKLFTNGERVSYELQGNVGYTSINDIAKQSDLISRQLKFELDIRTENIPESIFWTVREKEKPAILHYIFATIQQVIPIYKRLIEDPSSRTSHRLSDFILLCEAISQAIGQPEGRIIELFQRIEQEQAERSIDNNIFASFFADHVLNVLTARGNEITIQAKEIFDGLREHAALNNPSILDDIDFPKNAIQIGMKIERIRPSLRNFGIEITKAGRSSRGIMYRIRIIEKTAPQNQAQQQILPML